MRNPLMFLLLLLWAACGSTPEQQEPRKKTTTTAKKKAPRPVPKGEEGIAIERDSTEIADTRPIPKPTAKEMEDFNRIWEYFRRKDPRWPLERDRYKRRSDAAAYILAGHVLNYYMHANGQRDRAGKDVVRAKNEVVAVGEPCVPVLIDLMVLDQVPMGKGKHFVIDDITRHDCIDMLERMGSQATPLLLKTFDRPDLTIKGRRLTALALGGTRDRRGYDTLVELLMKDPSWQVRADAATALAKLGDRRALQPLGRAVETDKDAAVVKRAGKARIDLMRGRS